MVCKKVDLINLIEPIGKISWETNLRNSGRLFLVIIKGFKSTNKRYPNKKVYPNKRQNCMSKKMRRTHKVGTRHIIKMNIQEQ